MAGEYVECPVCKQGFYFEVEEEGACDVECENEDCSAPLVVHAALIYEVWATIQGGDE